MLVFAMGGFPNRDIASSMTSLRPKRYTVAGRVPPPEDVDSQFGSENEAVEQPSGSGLLLDTFAIGQEEVGERECLWGTAGGGDKYHAPNDRQQFNSAILVDISL